MFVIARFLLGFGIPFAIVAASSMIGELAYPKERARMGSLFNSSWFIGAIVAAGVTLGTFAMPTNWGWRIPSILQVCPSVLQLCFIWFLPESPRSGISVGSTLMFLPIAHLHDIDGLSPRAEAKKLMLYWQNTTQRVILTLLSLGPSTLIFLQPNGGPLY